MKRIAALCLLLLSLTLAACDGDKKVEPTLPPAAPTLPTTAPVPTPTPGSGAQESPLPVPPALQSPLNTPSP
ncbi:MAG: hypothetical protein HUU23_09905 [Caldilineales bacterium]|nr:hypothetical protein [Caldilineales bacterium]